MANGIVAAVIGMFIGGFIGDNRSGLAGVIFGGCCGYFLIAMGGLRQRMELLQKEVEQLRKQRVAAPEPKAKVSEPPPGAAMAATDRSDDEILDLVESVDESYITGKRESQPAAAFSHFKPDRQQIPANRESLAPVSSPPPMTEAT